MFFQKFFNIFLFSTFWSFKVFCFDVSDQLKFIFKHYSLISLFTFLQIATILGLSNNMKICRGVEAGRKRIKPNLNSNSQRPFRHTHSTSHCLTLLKYGGVRRKRGINPNLIEYSIIIKNVQVYKVSN